VSETAWEIDAKGVRESDGATVLVECRRYPHTRDNQKAAAALAWQIHDTGAGGGIHVSPLGFQAGAQRIADVAGIIEVTLNANATPKEFEMRFLDRLKIGLACAENVKITETVRVRLVHANGNAVSEETITQQG
jgi:hypothetical protein